MKALIRRCAPLICILPGMTATVFTVLAMARGGELGGLSTRWLLNCSLLAVPPLTLIIVGLVLVFLETGDA
jgi:hypothetical protein